MSYLVLDNSIAGLAGGWDIFGKQAKEKRKLKLGMQAQSFNEKMTLHRYEQEKAAIETFREKIRGKMEEVEVQALEGTAAMEKARKLSIRPELEGDPILDEFSEKVGELETAIVQVQTGTVIDTATFDTHRLAISYSDAQAALIAMRSITNRAVELSTLLKERMREIESERIRMEQLKKEREELAEIERKRAADFAREAELKQRAIDQRNEADRKKAVAAALRKATDKLRSERRKLDTVRRRIDELKQRRADDARRKAEQAQRLAEMRSGMRRASA
jgi:hypothetical protein